MNEDEQMQQMQWIVDNAEKITHLWEAFQQALEPCIEAIREMAIAYNEIEQDILPDVGDDDA